MLSLLAILASLPLAFAGAVPAVEPRANSDTSTCHSIAKVISRASAVFYPGSTSYTNDTFHYLPSSSQHAACSVEPGTTRDVSLILQVLSRTKTPFAIKSGGHQFNPGWSSTTGVQIAMSRFNSTVYNSHTNTVELGPGQPWNKVYADLAPLGVNVLGGRIYGVGVAGYLLGGGYSWNSNRYGIAIDSIISYELVLPNGQVVTVSEKSYSDLFFGLKGGFNNFGIVTKFVLKAFPQTKVWGGLINYGPEQLNATIQAVADFSANNTDVDADIIASYGSANGTTYLALMTFYNGPTPKKGIFDKFLAIPATSKDTSTREYLDFIVAASQPLLNPTHLRGGTNSFPLKALTPRVIAQIVNQTDYWGKQGLFNVVATGAEPFVPQSIIRRNAGLTAYPHSKFTTPTALTWFWDDESKDEACNTAILHAVEAMRAAAVADGQDLDGLMVYPNYAATTTPLKDMYGNNLPRLRKVAAKYDPHGVMRRAGGPKF